MPGVLLDVRLQQYNMRVSATPQPFAGLTAEKTWGKKEQNENSQGQ